MTKEQTISSLQEIFRRNDAAAQFFNLILDKGCQKDLLLRSVKAVITDKHEFLKDEDCVIADFQGQTYDKSTVLFNVQYLEEQEHLHGRLILEMAAACNSIALHHTMVMVYLVQPYLINNRPLQRLILQRRDQKDLKGCVYAVNLDLLYSMLEERGTRLSLLTNVLPGAVHQEDVPSAVFRGGLSM